MKKIFIHLSLLLQMVPLSYQSQQEARVWNSQPLVKTGEAESEQCLLQADENSPHLSAQCAGRVSAYFKSHYRKGTLKLASIISECVLWRAVVNSAGGSYSKSISIFTQKQNIF